MIDLGWMLGRNFVVWDGKWRELVIVLSHGLSLYVWICSVGLSVAWRV